MDSNSILYNMYAKVQQLPGIRGYWLLVLYEQFFHLCTGKKAFFLIYWFYMKLNKDYKNILLALVDRDVKFLLVGDIAMAINGKSASAMNLDIWVMPDAKNAPLVKQALKDFGAPADYLTAKDLQKEGIDFQIGLPPKRIRILTSVEGLKFDKSLAQSQKVELEGISVQVLPV